MKITWEVRKVRPSSLKVTIMKGKRGFEVFIKANVGHDEMLYVEAYDELDAWREAEQYIKEKYI